MKVLILFSITHQRRLIEYTCDALRNEGIHTDAIDIVSGDVVGSLPLNRELRCFKKMCGMSRISRVLGTPLLLRGLKKAWRDYDVIDVHGVFARAIGSIVEHAKSDGKKVKVMIWGSDFYRAPADKMERVRSIYNSCDIIQIATKQMKQDFLKAYPETEQKIRIVMYGSKQLDDLKDMLDGKLAPVPQLISPEAEGKCIVCLGYNGYEAQRHIQMLEAIGKLPQAKRESLFLLIPMTYGATPEYIEQVRMTADDIQTAYQIFTERLSTEEVLTLRVRTNVAVNIQDTDAFAGSIREHLMAKNLLVAGEWLPYKILSENGIYVRHTQRTNLAENISWAIDSYDWMSDTLRDNEEKVYKLCSWPSVSQQWVALYQELVANC